MMKRHWLLILATVLALAAGYVLGDCRARRLARNQWDFFACGQLNSELRWQENAAFYAYLDEPPVVAAGALESLIQAYRRYAANVLYITGKQNQEYLAHEMFTHLRLFKVYSKLDLADRAQRHLDQAIGLSNGKDADALMQMLEWADKAEAKTSRQWVVPTGER